MAYPMIGAKAHRANVEGTLKPFKGGIKMVAPRGGVSFIDSRGYGTHLAEGHDYRITGTKDGNGYVIAFDTFTLYLRPEHGVHLV